MELAPNGTRPNPDIQTSTDHLVIRKPVRSRKRRVDIAVALVLIVLVATAVIVAIVLSTTGSSSRGSTAVILPVSKTEKAMHTGVRWLLSRRDETWGWGRRQEAEAIMAVVLADDTWFNWTSSDTIATLNRMHLDILSALAKNNTLDDPNWYGGKLAQYISALLVTCYNPRDFYGFDLIGLLEDHVGNFPRHNFNHNFAYAWSVLSLCSAGAPVKLSYIEQLTKEAGNYSFGVEEASLSVLALVCMEPFEPSVRGAVVQARDHILSKFNKTGNKFGDIYQTAWAVQALDAIEGNSNLTALAKEYLIGQQGKDGSFSHISDAIHVLPALAGRSYVHIKNITAEKCQKYMTTVDVTTTPSSQITIQITVISSLTNMTSLNTTFTIQISVGLSLLDALTSLQQQEPTFSFSSTSSQWGEQVTSLMGVVSGSSTRTYWMITVLNGEALSVSVDNFKPTAGSHVQFTLTSY